MTDEIAPLRKFIPEQSRNRCGNCRFSFLNNNMIFCRRYPPQVTMIMVPSRTQPDIFVPQNYSSWPLVQRDQTCGEFRDMKDDGLAVIEPRGAA